MKSDDVLILTKYFAVWGWQLIALLFLCFAFAFLAMPRNGFTQVFYVSFFLIFVLTEFICLKRKKEFNNEANKS